MSTVRFTLQDNNGSVQFGSEKVSNWDELEPNLVRSSSYRGRVREITNTFAFVDDIRTRLIALYDNRDLFASLKIEIGNDNRDAFSYSQLGNGFPMVADFSQINIDELSCQLNFVDSEFQQKISDNEKEKLNITLAETLTGDTATDYNSLLKTIWMHDRTLELNSRFDFETLTALTGFFGNEKQYITFPMQINYNSDADDIKTVIGGIYDNIDAPELYFFFRSEEIKPINIDISFDLNISAEYFGSAGSVGTLNVIYRHVDLNDDVKEELTLATDTFIIGSTTIKRFTYSGSKSVDVAVDDNIGLFLEVSRPSGEAGALQITNIENLITEQVLFINETSSFDPTISNCILPHEFFTHWVELMTGHKNAFYSEFFGRTDLGYVEDGERAYFAIMDGHMIRNLPIEENPFNTSFKDVLEDMIKAFNLVGQIEYQGNVEVFRVEPYNVTFNQQTIIDLGELISGVERTQNNDLTWGSIKVGYTDLELENLNGLGIYNGELNYSIPLDGIDNELDLVLKGITADYAIEQQRRLQYSVAPDEDGKNDKKIFYVEAKVGYTTDLIAKTNEDYESVTGILSPSTAYNLGVTPAKILRNRGGVINGSLLSINNAVLRLTKSASNNTLITKKAGEDEIAENANIDASDLDNPIMLNEVLSIEECPLDKEQWDLLEENPNGIVKFVNKGFDMYGFIDKASYKQPNETGNFELTRANR